MLSQIMRQKKWSYITNGINTLTTPETTNSPPSPICHHPLQYVTSKYKVLILTLKQLGNLSGRIALTFKPTYYHQTPLKTPRVLHRWNFRNSPFCDVSIYCHADDGSYSKSLPIALRC